MSKTNWNEVNLKKKARKKYELLEDPSKLISKKQKQYIEILLEKCLKKALTEPYVKTKRNMPKSKKGATKVIYELRSLLGLNS